ncbi:hypothetical protein GQ53DRAFT_839036 [Thozetella sp. PMI_491]|nr:hypothetical protein GQ53DRAFT_839036 [Thozetella sp. PMI_491]
MASQHPDPLHVRCFNPDLLASNVREVLATRLWPKDASVAGTTESILDLSPYFDYVRHECNPAFQQQYAVATFEEIIFIIDMLRGNPTVTFRELQKLIQAARPALELRGLACSIELAVRLWLMLNARNIMPSNTYQLQTSVPWPDDASLQSVLIQHFAPQSDISSGTFSGHLNFHDMKSIAGIRVEWTNNLAMHLAIKGSIIYVFHCVSVLRWMRESPTTIAFLPCDLIEETLATIDLLAPLTNAKCNAWLANEISYRALDENMVHRDPPNRDKARYSYWHERLSIIEETFEKTKPITFIQWWNDRRDMQQWWGFWLVVTGIFLTVLFGLIQSVTGIIQVVRASR